MNKKVMAAAVAGALGALATPGVALAQASTVQIGGSITTFYYSHNPRNDSLTQRTDILETSEPELFVRGEENLGGGLTAWFQCTSSIEGLLSGSQTDNTWCGRNSGVGIKGNYGNIFQGNWDTPHKLVYNRARGWWGGTNSLTGGSARLLLGGSSSGIGNPVPGGGAPAAFPAGVPTGSASFFRRQATSWFYHSPSWNGFQVQGGVSAGNERTALADASALGPRLWSVAVHYDNGPLYLGGAYEKHIDYNPANRAVSAAASDYNGGDDHNWLLVAGYTFAGVFNIRGVYSHTKYQTTNVSDLSVRGYGIFADWTIAGPHTLRGQFAKLRDNGGSSGVSVGVFAPNGTVGGTGGKLWSLGYSYAISKRSEGSLVYTRISSDAGARHNLGKVAASLGQSQTSAGIVFKHRF